MEVRWGVPGEHVFDWGDRALRLVCVPPSLRFRVVGFEVLCIEFGVWRSGFMDQGSGFRV